MFSHEGHHSQMFIIRLIFHPVARWFLQIAIWVFEFGKELLADDSNKKGQSRTPSNGLLLFISYWDGLKSIFGFTALPHQLEREICIRCIFAGGSSLVVSDSFGDNDDNGETSTCQNLSMFLLGSCCFLNNTHNPRSIAGSNSSFWLAKPLSIFLFFLGSIRPENC